MNRTEKVVNTTRYVRWRHFVVGGKKCLPDRNLISNNK